MVIAAVTNTVEAVLCILALSVLIGPHLAERLRIPGLVGLIFVGMLLGPDALGWLRADGVIAGVGAMGLLYLMYLAGVELDLKAFAANRTAALTFGALTFLLPFTLSFAVGWYHLSLTFGGAALIGSMWASHTLVAYPEVKSAGLDRARCVGVAVSSTVITDIVALVILALATASAPIVNDTSGSTDTGHPLPLWVGLPLLVAFTLWLLPRLTRWWFVRVSHSREERFVFALAAMSASGVIALLGGIEGLVGAFLAGIGTNREIPARGELMERIEFFGSALFIPAFLISVGLSIDPAALVQRDTIELALIFTALVVVGKVLAAAIAGLIFHFSWDEVALMAALTSGQAAATLAIAEVGVSTGYFDQDILNAAVLTVVITVLITSIGTRVFARRLEVPSDGDAALGSVVLVNAGDLETSPGVMALVADVARADGGIITPYLVCDQTPGDDERAVIAAAEEAAIALGHDVVGVTRVAETVRGGVVGLALEQGASLLVLPWNWPNLSAELTLGASIGEIGGQVPIPVALAHLVRDTWSRVVVVTGRTGTVPAHRKDLATTCEVARRVAGAGALDLVAYVPTGAGALDLGSGRRFETVIIENQVENLLDELGPDDLVLVPIYVAQRIAGLGERLRARIPGDRSIVVVASPIPQPTYRGLRGGVFGIVNGGRSRTPAG